MIWLRMMKTVGRSKKQSRRKRNSSLNFLFRAKVQRAEKGLLSLLHLRKFVNTQKAFAPLRLCKKFSRKGAKAQRAVKPQRLPEPVAFAEICKYAESICAFAPLREIFSQRRKEMLNSDSTAEVSDTTMMISDMKPGTKKNTNHFYHA